MPDALLVSSELAPGHGPQWRENGDYELSDVVQPRRRALWHRVIYRGKVVTFGGGYALWRDGILVGRCFGMAARQR